MIYFLSCSDLHRKLQKKVAFIVFCRVHKARIVSVTIPTWFDLVLLVELLKGRKPVSNNEDRDSNSPF